MILFISHSSGITGAGNQLIHTLMAFDEICPEKKKIVLLPRRGPLYDVAGKFAQVITFPYSWWVVPKNLPLGNSLVQRFSRHTLPFFFSGFLLNMFSTLLLSLKLEPEIIWTNSSVVPIGGFLWLIKKRRNRRKIHHVWHVHEILKENKDIVSPLGDRTFDLIYTMSDRIIAVSQFCAQQFKKKDKVRIIYNTVRVPHFGVKIISEKLKEIKTGEKIVGVVGNITRNKNQLLALKVMERLNSVDESIKLFFVGGWDKKYKEEVERYMSEKKIKNVFFTGFVKDIREIYRKIHVLLITSYIEVNPLSAIESMAFGVPVVSTYFPGAEETIKAGFICGKHRDGKPGEYYDEDVVADELAEKILKLFKDEKLYREVSMKSRRVYEENFSFEIYKRKISDIIEELGI